MKLYMPTLVFNEINCVMNHSKELASLGKKAMIITGKHSSKVNGSLKDVTTALTKEKIEYIIFDEIEENPSIETVMKAKELGVLEKVDFIIGIGGGSPMDAAKAIALMVTNQDKDQNILYDKISLPCMPVVAVPTTAGTGSEVTPYAILTIHSLRTKRGISHRIFPKLALIDSSYLTTASRKTIIETAVDALSHLIESYLNTNSNEFNRIYSEKGLKTWKKVKDNLKGAELKAEDYEHLMQASTLAGIAIAHTGTSLPHGLSYLLTYELGIPHGKAVGMFLAGYVKCYKKTEDALRIVRLLGFEDIRDFELYLKDLLGTVEVSEELMEQNIEDLLSNKAKLANYPYPITKEELYTMTRF